MALGYDLGLGAGSTDVSLLLPLSICCSGGDGWGWAGTDFAAFKATADLALAVANSLSSSMVGALRTDCTVKPSSKVGALRTDGTVKHSSWYIASKWASLLYRSENLSSPAFSCSQSSPSENCLAAGCNQGLTAVPMIPTGVVHLHFLAAGATAVSCAERLREFPEGFILCMELATVDAYRGCCQLTSKNKKN